MNDINVHITSKKSPISIIHRSSLPRPETPADPGKLFIWKEPYEPIIKIKPKRYCNSNNPAFINKPSLAKAIFLGFNRLGDFICTIPVIHSFRRLNPGTFIIYIVQDVSYCRLLEGNPDIDLVIYSEELYYFGEKILSEEWLSSLPVEIEQPAYLYRFNIHEVCRIEPTVFNDHISRGYGRYLKIPVDSVRPILKLSEEDHNIARSYVQKPYIVISMHSGSEVVGTGGKLVLKDWIFERWLRLAKALSKSGEFDIIAIGSTTDVQVKSRYFRNLYGLPIKVVAALIKEASCVITVESGISHLCHAVDAPMVVIFSRYVCFPWAFPREASCCRIIYKDPRLISVNEVLSAVNGILAQNGDLS